MGESNRVRMAYIVESSLGVPGASPTLKELRVTDGGIKVPTETVVSAERRSDRMRADVARVGQSANASLSAEFPYGAFDELLEAMLCGTWSAAVNFAGAVTIDYTAGVATVTATGAFTNVVVGQWIQLGAMSQAANNGTFRVTARASADEVTIDTHGVVMVDEVDAAATIKSGGMLRNGTTARSIFLEQQHLDIGVYLRAYGLRPNSATLTVPTGGLVTLAMELLGQSADVDTSTLSGAVTAAGTTDVINGTSNISNILENDDEVTESVAEIAFTVGNNVRQRKALKSLTPVALPYGTQDVTGSVKLYPSDETYPDLYLAFTKEALAFRTVDAAGNAYVFTFPRKVFTDGIPAPGAIDTDVMLDLPFTAMRDATTNCQIQIDRFPAV